MTTGPIKLREDWFHTDGKAHTRLNDSYDDLEGVTKLAMLSWDTVGMGWVKFTGGGGGGGGAVTMADGANVTQGAKADAAWDGSAASASMMAVDKYIATKIEAVRALLAGTLTVGLPTGASTATRQDTGNTSLGSIDTKLTGVALDGIEITGVNPSMPAGGVGLRGWLSAIWQRLNGTLAISAVALPLPTGASTESTLLLIKAKTDNLDAALSTRTKPADTQITDPIDRAGRVLGTVTVNKTDQAIAAPTTATVGVASAIAVAANANRKGLHARNTSTSGQRISLGFDGNAAVLDSGVTLYPQDVFNMDGFDFTTGAVEAIASAAAGRLSLQESS